MRIISCILLLVSGSILPWAVRGAAAVDLPEDIHYAQCGESWSSDLMGEPGACYETVCSAGCIITSGAMLLSWVAGAPGYTDPGVLNAWLQDNGGYTGCLTMWYAIGAYDGVGVGLELADLETFAFDDWSALDAELDAADRMPLVGVLSNSHWVVVYDRVGPSGDPSSYRILDPSRTYSPDHTLADYPDGDRWIFKIARFSGTFPMGALTGAGGSGAPMAATVLQNAPNPFNPQTTIAFELPRQEVVTLRVFDMAGRLVRVLVDGKVYGQGRHEEIWRGKDDFGRQCASGTYFYRLEAGEFSETKKMTLLK